MSAVVGVSTDGVRVPIARDRVAKIARAVLEAEGVRDAMLSITFVTNGGIQSLNRTHRRRTGVTDVIAFGFRRTSKDAPIVGDVYIAPAVARASARSNDVSLREEIVRLIVHGTLHVLGYDHPDSDARTHSPMWKKQERLVRRLAAART
jgi:probable rRNA maturation factor